jgi:hypothetical protein
MPADQERGDPANADDNPITESRRLINRLQRAIERADALLAGKQPKARMQIDAAAPPEASVPTRRGVERRD